MTGSDAVRVLPTADLGLIGYEDAYRTQLERHAAVLADRERGAGPPGVLLLLEHRPVVTVTSRPGAAGHVLADAASLARDGIELCETNRGGDVTYHGPGQLVCYPIVDLKRLGGSRGGLGLHEYIRALESAVIETLAAFGIAGHTDPAATGVWVPGDPGATTADGRMDAKACAIGVRVRRWVTLHGLALNVRTNLDHFSRIVPCGLVGRPVTSLERVLGGSAPTVDEVKPVLARCVSAALWRAGTAQRDRPREGPRGLSQEPR